MSKTFPKKLDHYEFFDQRWSEPRKPHERFRYHLHDPLWLRIMKQLRDSNKRYRLGMDLGAGDGRMSIDIADLFDQFIFIEQSREAIKCIIFNYEKNYHRSAEAYQIDLSRFTTQKAKIPGYEELIDNVDLIILSHVVHYLSRMELKELLTEIKNLLKKGGRCYVACETNIEQILPPNPRGYKFFTFRLEVNHSAEYIEKLIKDLSFALLETHVSQEKPVKTTIPKPFFDKHMRKALGFPVKSLNEPVNSYTRKFDLLEFYFEKK